MSIDQIGQYAAKTSPFGGLRTATVSVLSSASSSAGVEVFAPSDGVSVGKLAQALKGPASGAFQHLDPKARGMLEGLVNSGKISAEDAVRGLNHLAKNAVFDRYMNETSNSAEGTRTGQPMAGTSKKLGEGARAGERALASMSSLDQSYRQGDVSDADYASQVRAAGKEFESTMLSNGDSGDALAEFGKSMASSFAKKIEGFENEYGAENVPNNDPSTSGDLKALKKLESLGFGASMYREAMTRYATGANPQNFDAPSTAASNPASTVETAPTPTDAPPQATTQAAANTATPTPVAAKSTTDPGNAQAALSMLQSALSPGAQKTGSGNILGVAPGGVNNVDDTSSTSLLEALKSGIDQTKTWDSKSV